MPYNWRFKSLAILIFLMRTLIVKNFGPIHNDEGVAVVIHPVTVFCGDQGTGKSTVAKLISEFTWLEKALSRGDFLPKEITRYDRFRKKYCAFHNIQNYFKENTYLFFDGDKYRFEYKDGHLSVQAKQMASYLRPQVFYIPAERNLVSAIESAEKIKRLPPALSTLLDEYTKALRSSRVPLELPLPGYSVQYDRLNKVAWLVGDGFRIRTYEAASGLQSVTPLSVVSNYLNSKVNENSLSDIVAESSEERQRLEKTVQAILRDKTIDDTLRVALIKELNATVPNKRFVNIVEEPEQNLYPTSQMAVLFELLRIKNTVPENELIFTTHSPYLINYLTIALKAGIIRSQRSDSRIDEIIPPRCDIKPGQLAIYQLESSGAITELPFVEGLPSDDNYLNDSLEETNRLFDRLLGFDVEG